MNFDSLVKISSKKAERGMPTITKPSNTVCKHCQIGKQTKVSFKTKEYSTTRPLELIHTDLYGHMRTKGWNGERYFMLFIDDFTRITWACFLKEKSKEFEKFRTFRPMIENEMNLRLKCLRSDRGGEPHQMNLKNTVKNMVEKDKSLQARTPQQNGVVERKNRIVPEMARTLLNESKLTDRFWKDVHTTIYILNKMQPRPNSSKTHYELRTGRTTSVSHFRVFGSKCYIKCDDENLGKFDARSNEGYFVGYCSRSKAYKCYNMRLRRIVESIHVKFDEDTLCTPIAEDDSNEPKPIHIGPIVDEPTRKDTKAPSKVVQGDHAEEKIIGDKNVGVQTRRKIAMRTQEVQSENDTQPERFALLSLVEPCWIIGEIARLG